MSQVPAAQWGLSPTGPGSGTEVAARANGTFNALLSSHSGASEPAYRVTGTQWLDTASGSAYRVKMFTGSAWRTLVEFNPSGTGIRLAEATAAESLSIDSAGFARVTYKRGGTTQIDSGIGVQNGFGDSWGLNVANTTGVISFAVNSSEKLRIHAGGNITLGKSTTAITDPGWMFLQNGGIPYATIVKTATGAINVMDMFHNGTGVGSITMSNTGTAYNTSSDYRLKENIEDLTGSGEFIDALRPVEFNWKSTGEQSAGFIAHEFQAVSPSSVMGEKDAVREDGSPAYQSMQASSPEVMAHIISELQSLRRRVAELEAAAAGAA